jgi:cytochrome oxidase Cu insertion factor (SCO1/SenC/PrrC family)
VGKIGRAFLWLVPMLVVLNVSCARGAVAPAATDSGRIPDVAIWDETGRAHSLWKELQGAGVGPVIVLPVYTRCAASCPTLTRKLEQEASRIGADAHYRVVVFSFDPAETAASLLEFRKREHLPANWLLVRAEEAEARRFFRYFQYSIMSEGAVLVHPNEIFLLDHDLRWRATLLDVDWNGGELREWIERVESPGIRGWLAMHPEKLAWAGFSGMLLGAGFCIAWMIRRRPSQRSIAV